MEERPRDVRASELPGPDDQDRSALTEFALARGATPEEVDVAGNLGELALDVQLRPRTGSTLREAVERAGLDWNLAQRLVRATGLHLEPGDQVTAGEIATLQLFDQISRTVLGEEAAVQLARVAGNAMARVAETIVASLRLRFEVPRRTEGLRYSDLVKEYSAIAETTLPSFVRGLDVLLRRQMVAVAEGIWSTDEERSAVTLPRCIGFADLVGYTAASASMSVRELTSVLAEFDELTTEVVQRHDGQIVKTIGDEAMFVTEHADDACLIGLALVNQFALSHSPPIRVGISAGEVISVGGDLYGPDVNLAARLVAIAEPSTVVVSGTARSAAEREFAFERLPDLTLKGFPGPVEAYRLGKPAAG